MLPLDGRRLWLVGIGGAGLSAYGILARAWGAEVAGWDRVETPYLARVRADGIPVTIGPEPVAGPAGYETIVSTAFAGQVPGKSRSELLAELVSLRRSIVVTGAHGKTTTSAMIAFCLQELAQEPAYLIGAEVPQLGGNAGTGEGWLVVEGDESDRTAFALEPEIAVVTNVELDHHTTFGSLAELEECFRRWIAGLGEASVVWGPDLEPTDVPLAIAGEHNRRNAACALAALELVGISMADSARALRDFTGAGRRFELRGESAGVRLYDDYAHHPTEVTATLATARSLAGAGRIIAVFQPHLYSRTAYLAHEFATALARADAAVVTEIYPAREEPWPEVTGKLVVDRLTEIRPGMQVGWARRLDDATMLVVATARAGDVVLTLGAGDIETISPAILERLGR
ncbi:MAG TPA: cyanophycin synthetase [Gaiellaceae bacterium]|nr:cyanophycin synthetase [Gaiellaceae bacterium]